MNIKQAKEEIKNTLTVYFTKNEFGNYVIPIEKQRPVFLMGPPGIGKTAIMAQIASEMGVGLLSYSMTHHTRQSAIGLPFIEKKTFNGQEYTVSEYTLSEIVASVYELMETTGLKEGILFLDEINCVSETLAPVMLQLLQYKVFGKHKIPAGWVIVTAGNPPEYNNAVREYDIATWDRLKRIDINPDFEIWKEYAYKANVHMSIISYLESKTADFYTIETTVDSKAFATARGWEDLSTILKVYEEMNLPVDEGLVYQYLQHKKIAKDFANYLDLYKKYRTDYRVDDILRGEYTKQAVEKLQAAPFDERLSVMGLLLSRLSENFRKAYEADLMVTGLHGVLLELKERFSSPYCKETPWENIFTALLEEREFAFTRERKAGLLEKTAERARMKELERLHFFMAEAKKAGCREKEEAFEVVKGLFAAEAEEREETIELASAMLANAFSFLEETFGANQEMVIFITELTTNFYSVKFISENGCEKYYQYNTELLFDEKQKTILQDIEKAKTELDLLF